MLKQTLRGANAELFRRTPDEMFAGLPELAAHCRAKHEASRAEWHPPKQMGVCPSPELDLMVYAGHDGAETHYRLNDWSFGQLCQLAHVAKETVNRLSPQTASDVFRETLPRGEKPIQLFTRGGSELRSLHGPSYTRLSDIYVVSLIQEFAVDFQPPQRAVMGGTGLYCGEQDLFCFLVDPTGWVEIEGEAFAPGFFLYNSEVGKRSLGIQTFWFQKVCANHLVWDAVEVVEFTRKHTASVHDALGEIRRIIWGLVERRDARRDAFAQVVAKAMREKLGDDAEEALKILTRQGITRSLAKEAVESARRQGGLTIFSVVDALTRIAGQLSNAGERTDADERAAKLFDLVAA